MAIQKKSFKKKISDKEIDEQIGILAGILVEAFIWQHEHKDKAPEPYIPKARNKKGKNPQDFHPGQTFYL